MSWSWGLLNIELGPKIEIEICKWEGRCVQEHTQKEMENEEKYICGEKGACAHMGCCP